MHASALLYVLEISYSSYYSIHMQTLQDAAEFLTMFSFTRTLQDIPATLDKASCVARSCSTSNNTPTHRLYVFSFSRCTHRTYNVCLPCVNGGTIHAHAFAFPLPCTIMSTQHNTTQHNTCI